jgi:hypothetical protein
MGRIERKRVVAVELDPISNDARPLATYSDDTWGVVAFSCLPTSIALSDSSLKPLFMSREDAIDMAQRILRAYEVPFCNRIKDSGTSG